MRRELANCHTRVRQNFYMSSNMPPPQLEAVDFTTVNIELIVCSRCKAPLKATEMHFMANSKPNTPGRHVCGSCHRYYIHKTEQRCTISIGEQVVFNLISCRLIFGNSWHWPVHIEPGHSRWETTRHQ